MVTASSFPYWRIFFVVGVVSVSVALVMFDSIETNGWKMVADGLLAEEECLSLDGPQRWDEVLDQMETEYVAHLVVQTNGQSI